MFRARGPLAITALGRRRHARNLTTTPPPIAPLTIGNLQLPSSIILSPLERISDVGFRNLCFHNGAGLTWTEMIHSSELVRPKGSDTADLPAARAHPRGGRGAHLIDTFDPTVPTGVQLLVDRTTARDGHGTDLLRRALEQLEDGANGDQPHWKNIRAVDLNFGCPAPDVSRRGAGPAQLRRRSKMRALFDVLEDWRKHTDLDIGAVGAKIRLGNNERERDFQVHLPVAEAAAEVGLDYLVVHARHGGQRSRDVPDWGAIGDVKRAVGHDSDMQIIGNGDVRTPEDVVRMQRLTNCDGIMVGRAAMRNPWILGRLAAAFNRDAIEGAGETREGSGEVWNEWPSLEELERAQRENMQWSQNQKAAARYSRFRQENFERLRRVVLSSAANPLEYSEESQEQQPGDWYQEWSAAAKRRRHLDQAEEGGKVERGTRRRSGNSRDWKARSSARDGGGGRRKNGSNRKD